MILITGGTGFLGTALTERLRDECIPYEYLLAESGQLFRLGNTPNHLQTTRATCLIHLAWERIGSDLGLNDPNYRCTTELLNICKTNDIRFVFISSYSVLFSSHTIYAKTKSRTEIHVKQNGGVIIRPALVISHPAQSALGRLVKVVNIFGVLPDRSKHKVFVHTVLLEQFTQCCINHATSPEPPGSLHNCAEMRPVSLSSLVPRIIGQRIKVLKLPTLIIRLIIKILKVVPFTASVGDSLDGLYGSTTTDRDLVGAHDNSQ